MSQHIKERRPYHKHEVLFIRRSWLVRNHDIILKREDLVISTAFLFLLCHCWLASKNGIWL